MSSEEANNLGTSTDIFGMIIGSFCHELNNPLTVLGTAISQLKKMSTTDIDEERFVKSITRLENSASKLMNVSKNMGIFATLSRSEATASFELDEALQAAEKVLHHRITGGLTGYQTQLGSESFVVKGDKNLFGLGVIFLMNTIVKALQKSELKTISLNLVKSNETAHIKFDTSLSCTEMSSERVSSFLDTEVALSCLLFLSSGCKAEVQTENKNFCVLIELPTAA